jgi:hypothetical protein
MHLIYITAVQLQQGLQLWSWVLGQQITTWTWGCAGQQWRSLFSQESILAVQKSRKEYVAVPRSPLSSVLGSAVRLPWLQAQVQNIMFSGLGLPGPTQRENRGVQQLSSWTVAISLRAVAQKLHWLRSFPRGFGGSWGFPTMLLGSSILVQSVWCPRGFLCLNGYSFL